MKKVNEMNAVKEALMNIKGVKILSNKSHEEENIIDVRVNHKNYEMLMKFIRENFKTRNRRAEADTLCLDGWFILKNEVAIAVKAR